MLPILLAHSWLRWFVLIAGLVAFARAVAGLNGRRPWTAGDNRGTLLFTIFLDVQTLLGLALYTSLGVRTAVGHVVGMALALVMAHVGRVRIRRAKTSEDRHLSAALFMGLALLAILLSIPWTAPFIR